MGFARFDKSKMKCRNLQNVVAQYFEDHRSLLLDAQKELFKTIPTATMLMIRPVGCQYTLLTDELTAAVRSVTEKKKTKLRKAQSKCRACQNKQTFLF